MYIRALRPSGVLIDGPPPLGKIEVPLDEGLTVLYGLNGAGKSRLLAGVAAALRGDAGSVLLAETSNARDLSNMVSRGRREWLQGVDAEELDWKDAERRPPWHDPGRSALDRELGDHLLERWFYAPTLLTRSRDESLPRRGEVIEEVLRNRVFMASRSAKDPFWNLYLGVRLDPLSTPRLDSLRRRILELWAKFLDELERLDKSRWADAVYRAWASDGWADAFSADWFFTVFGDLPTRASGQWDPRDEEADFDLSAMQECMDALSKERTILNLAGWKDDRLGGFVPSGWHLLTDEGLTDLRSLPSRTTESLQMFLSTWLAVEEDQVVVHPTARTLCAELSARATRYMQAMLPGAPELICVVRSADSWVKADAVAWHAIDPSGAEVEIESLSNAQTRVAGIATWLALASLSTDPPQDVTTAAPEPLPPLIYADSQIVAEDDPFWANLDAFRDPPPLNVMLLDEPEAGLHELARRHLARALNDLCRDDSRAGLVVSHSPAFLGAPGIRRILVERDIRGLTSIQEIEFPHEADAERLGVDVADLLLLRRVIVLVEGRHDEVLLNELLADELKRRDALLIPLRGAIGLKKVVDLQLVARTLTLPVVVVLDNADAGKVAGLRDALRAIPNVPEREPEVARACDGFLASSGKPTEEAKLTVQLLRELHTRGSLERFSIYAFSARDVLDYLPPECLDSARAGQPFQSTKDWMSKEQKNDLTDDAIRLGCNELLLRGGAPPSDFLDLLSHIDDVLAARERQQGYLRD